MESEVRSVVTLVWREIVFKDTTDEVLELLVAFGLDDKCCGTVELEIDGVLEVKL